MSEEHLKCPFTTLPTVFLMQVKHAAPADKEKNHVQNPSCVDTLETPTDLLTEQHKHSLDKEVMVFACDYQVPLPRPNHATFEALTRGWIISEMVTYLRDLTAQCQAANPVVRHVKGATEHQPGVLHCDVCGPFEEANDKGEKLLLVMELQDLNKDRRLVLLPHCVPLVHKTAAAIVNFINRIPELTLLRGFQGLHISASSHQASDVRPGI
eukprot:3960866-Amphidinium_carterae.1